MGLRVGRRGSAGLPSDSTQPADPPASTYQVFVRLAWCQRTEVFGCGPGTTLRNLKVRTHPRRRSHVGSWRFMAEVRCGGARRKKKASFTRRGFFVTDLAHIFIKHRSW